MEMCQAISFKLESEKQQTENSDESKSEVEQNETRGSSKQAASSAKSSPTLSEIKCCSCLKSLNSNVGSKSVQQCRLCLGLFHSNGKKHVRLFLLDYMLRSNSYAAKLVL